MRALSKHFAELGLSYADVHKHHVEGTKGWLRQNFKCLCLLSFNFEFASDAP
jgi:hypothetical protein